MGLAVAQARHDAMQPPEFYSDDALLQRALEGGATRFIEVIQSGDPAAMLPLDGPGIERADMQSMITWVGNDAARILLEACALAMKPGADQAASDRACVERLHKFIAHAAADYASDNVACFL